MTNAITGEPVRVEVGAKVGPHPPRFSIDELPVSQVPAVTRALDAHGGIEYWQREAWVSRDGRPPTTSIHFARRVDPAVVQRILDSLP
jgi:hypothetical protein